MARPNTIDLSRDGRDLLEVQWLAPGETLRVHHPVWKLVRLEGIPKPAPNAGQVIRKTLWVLSRIPVYVFIAWLLVLAANAGGDLGAPSRKRPAVVIWGNDSSSRAGRLVSPALRTRGIWVLSDRRFSLIAPLGKSYSKLFSSRPGETIGKPEQYEPVPITTILESPALEWRYEGIVERTRRGRLTGRERRAGDYHRVVFVDGSGVDFLAERQR